MKRSEVDTLIDETISLIASHNITLPPFAYWSAEEWGGKGDECDEIRSCKLGWDITDFGSGRFDEIGLVVFTIRNGHPTLAPYNSKPYAEKLLIVQSDQHTPMHHHVRKREDIICRAGGNLLVRVFGVDSDGRLSRDDVEVSLDGVRYTRPAGHVFRLRPGESITLTPDLYHEFWGEPGTGTVIAGEVSSVNDDDDDNDFLDPVGRFPDVVEDQPCRHLLCTEY